MSLRISLGMSEMGWAAELAAELGLAARQELAGLVLFLLTFANICNEISTRYITKLLRLLDIFRQLIDIFVFSLIHNLEDLIYRSGPRAKKQTATNIPYSQELYLCLLCLVCRRSGGWGPCPPGPGWLIKVLKHQTGAFETLGGA